MKRFWRKQLPAALLALIMMISIFPVAMAAETGTSSSNPGEETEGGVSGGINVPMGTESILIYKIRTSPIL